MTSRMTDRMVVGILQPGYLPWLGFFEQLARSDVFVLYDDVQYDKHGWRNRNRIKTANGVQWLTVPVHCRFEDRPLLNEIRIDHSRKWQKKHAASLRQSYARAPHFTRYWPIFEEVFDRDWELLVDLDIHFIEKLAECLRLSDRRLVRSSTLQVSGDRIERLVDICRKLGASVFYEGAAGRDYIDAELFARQGVRVEFQDYTHPVYRQLHGDFAPYLSIVDLLFNHGDDSLEILFAKHREDCK